MLLLKTAVILISSLLYHPVHVSLASVDYHKERGEFKFFVKLFTHDIEDDCRLLYNDWEMEIFNEQWVPDTLVVSNYIVSRFELVVNGESLQGKITSLDCNEDEVRINMLFPFEGEVSEVVIVNRFMTELFEDQANFLIFKSGSYEEGVMFDPCITEHVIKLPDRSFESREVSR